MLKRVGITIAVIGLVLISAWRLEVALGEEAAPAPPLAAAPEVVAPTAAAPSATGREQRTVTGVSGRVERRGPTGTWETITVGASLAVDDHLRTFKDSTATVALGDAVTIAIAESTAVSMGSLTATLSRVRLDDGRLASVVRGKEGFRFRVEVRGSDVHADTARGSFSVHTPKAGHATVAAMEGAVDLTAAGKTVSVQRGKTSVVTPRSAPSAPFDIPPSLFLHLGPPRTRVQRKTVILKGTTTPGAVVSTPGGQTVASGNGTFKHEVKLVAGHNNIVVEVRDALGRRKAQRLPRITVDARLNTDPTGEVEW